MLIAQTLQKAGLRFMKAKGTHLGRSGIRIDEIVCATAEDVAQVDAWAEREGFVVRARVASEAEVAEYNRIVW